MELEPTSEPMKQQSPHAFDAATLSGMSLASLLYCVLIGDPRVYSRLVQRVESASALN